MSEDPDLRLNIKGKICFWCKKNCGGTCLGVNHENGPRQMKADDPAYWMLKDGHTTTPTVHDDDCYICNDPEFAQMGLPLCRPCPQCSVEHKAEHPEVDTHVAGHIPADDEACSVCGYVEQPPTEAEEIS